MKTGFEGKRLDENHRIGYTNAMDIEKKSKTITTYKELEKRLTLTSDERDFINLDGTLPLKITEHYFSLIDKDDPNDPLRRQVIPTVHEGKTCPDELHDPLAEVEHSIHDRLIHRYPSRAAFLVTDICSLYCRHCFRRRFTGTFQGPARKEEIEQAASYLQKHPTITELLLTGGDMMTLPDSSIIDLIATFRRARKDLIIRLCTRMPAVDPERITPSLVAAIRAFDTAPFFLMTQFNHPRELTAEAIKAVSLFVDAGIPAMNQSVLLRGVNDNADTLEELCNKLLFSRIKPYYLFQGDLVSGTAHQRVPLEKGLALEKELRRRLSGMAMPLYAVDLPHGGGKVPLIEGYIVDSDSATHWNFITAEGKQRSYPKEH